MRDRGKRELEAYNNAENFVSYYEFPCKKHPSSSSSSSSGICAYCLSDRLVQLVCPVCGEQRLPSCSCADEIASNRFSGARISNLIESDKPDFPPAVFRPPPSSQAHLKRSSSSTCVGDMMSREKRRESVREERSGSGFWKIGKLFRKKSVREKKGMSSQLNDIENKSELGVSDCVPPVSRSRSLCSFRGFYDTESSGGLPMSSSAARASSVSGNFVLDSAKRSCFSESEARMSNFDYSEAFNFCPNGIYNNNVRSSMFSWRESEFASCGDDPAYIDLKLHDLYSDSNNADMYRRGGHGIPTKDFGLRGEDDIFKNGRLSVSERELRKCRKSYKVWKWFFRQQSSSRSKEEREDHHTFKY